MAPKDDTRTAEPQDPAVGTVRQSRQREETPSQQSEALLAEFDTLLDGERAAALEAKKPSTERYFVHCEGCGKPAIFLTRYPHDFRIDRDDWFARYKPAGIPYYAPQLKCQNCSRIVPLAPDEERGLGAFTVEETAMRLVLSIEDRERRKVKAQRELDEIKTLKGVPTITVTPGQKVAEKARG